MNVDSMEMGNGGEWLDTHFSFSGEIEVSDFNFRRHVCRPRRAVKVNQEMMIDVEQTFNNTIVTVSQETKTKCFPIIIFAVKELTSTQLSHCHCSTSCLLK